MISGLLQNQVFPEPLNFRSLLLSRENVRVKCSAIMSVAPTSV